MKIYNLIFIPVLFLTACAGAFVAPQPLTETQITSFNPAQLCSLRVTSGDIRVSERIKNEKIDCSPASLVCSNQGYKKGTKKYAACLSNYQREATLEQKRKNNPEWARCTDNGFKEGTQAMATCMSGLAIQKQQAELIEIQKDQLEQQKINNTLNQLNSLNRPAVKTPITTNCYKSGNIVNCTTY